MQNEKQLDIVKLLALYRWSLFGKIDLAVPFTYSDNSFYTDSSTIDGVWGLLFDIDSMLSLNSPDWSFVTNSDGTVTFMVIIGDISNINPNTNYKFNDVLCYVSGSIKLSTIGKRGFGGLGWVGFGDNQGVCCCLVVLHAG